MAVGTQSTGKDVQIALIYGFDLYPTTDVYPHAPNPSELGADMLEIDLAISPTNSLSTYVVNSTGYIDLAALHFGVDFSVTSYTHFRLLISGESNQAGQTITAQLARQSSPTQPLSGGGNDIQLANLDTDYDSGWLAFATPLIAYELLTLALKGSNTTVDISYNNIRLILKYSP